MEPAAVGEKIWNGVVSVAVGEGCSQLVLTSDPGMFSYVPFLDTASTYFKLINQWSFPGGQSQQIFKKVALRLTVGVQDV